MVPQHSCSGTSRRFYVAQAYRIRSTFKLSHPAFSSAGFKPSSPAVDCAKRRALINTRANFDLTFQACFGGASAGLSPWLICSGPCLQGYSFVRVCCKGSPITHSPAGNSSSLPVHFLCRFISRSLHVDSGLSELLLYYIVCLRSRNERMLNHAGTDEGTNIFILGAEGRGVSPRPGVINVTSDVCTSGVGRSGRIP